jgi:hypothetical protein
MQDAACVVCSWVVPRRPCVTLLSERAKASSLVLRGCHVLVPDACARLHSMPATLLPSASAVTRHADTEQRRYAARAQGINPERCKASHNQSAAQGHCSHTLAVGSDDAWTGTKKTGAWRTAGTFVHMRSR